MEESRKLKSIIKKIWIVSFAVSLVIAILFIFVFQDMTYDTWAEFADNRIVHHSGKNDILENILTDVFLVQVIVFVALIVLNIIDKIKNKSKIFVSVVVSSVLFVFNFFSMSVSMICVDDSMDDYSPTCYCFRNDDRTIVVEEYSYLLLGGANVWQVNSDNSVYCIGGFTTDDGGRNYGKYELDWSAESITITYDYCNLSHDKVTKKFDFI